MFKNGKFVISVTKHAAERIFQRSDNVQEALCALEKARYNILLHVYNSISQGRPQNVVVDKHVFILWYDEVTKKMLLKTYYKVGA